MNAPINDGGPAFPESGSRGVAAGGEGMTLRDYFASAALQGLCGNSGGPFQACAASGWRIVNCAPSDIAKVAYDCADAMLAARGGAS